MKLRRLCMAGAILALCFSMTACSTIKCEKAERLDGKRIKVTAKRSSVNGLASAVVSGLGQRIPISQTSGALQQAGSAIADLSISAAEAKAIVTALKPEAEEFIRSRPDLFCDECSNGTPCQSEVHNLQLELDDYTVGQREVIMIFKIIDGDLSCGPCPGCQDVAMRGLPQTEELGGMVACTSEQQIVIDGEAFAADLVAQELGFEASSPALTSEK